MSFLNTDQGFLTSAQHTLSRQALEHMEVSVVKALALRLDPAQ